VLAVTAAGSGPNAAPASVDLPLEEPSSSGTQAQPLGGCPDGVAALLPPLKELKVKSAFGLRPPPIPSGEPAAGEPKPELHPGVDFVAADGTDVYPPGTGTVVQSKESDGSGTLNDNKGAGGTVTLDIPGSGYVQFMHLKKDSIEVKVGDKVSPDRPIAKSDNTGHSTGAHLHMEHRPGGKGALRIDPMLCLDDSVVQHYVGTFSASYVDRLHPQDTVESARLRGKFQFDLTLDVPGLAPERFYALSSSEFTLERWDRQDSCSVGPLVDNQSAGELHVSLAKNTYELSMLVAVTFRLDCIRPDGTHYPLDVAPFGNFDDPFIGSCNPGSFHFPYEAPHNTFVDPRALTGKQALECPNPQEPRGSLTVASDWSLHKE
jgi:murein DD-endopeptidase MepM/ murein hydrolase activator NlpD